MFILTATFGHLLVPLPLSRVALGWWTTTWKESLTETSLWGEESADLTKELQTTLGRKGETAVYSGN